MRLMFLLIHFKLMDAKTNDDLRELGKNDEVINLLSQCRETSVLQELVGLILYTLLITRYIKTRNGCFGIMYGDATPV